MTDLQNLKKIKYILEEEKWNRANVQEVLLVVDKMIVTKTKKRKTGVSAAKKAPKKKAPEMFSWEWWMA
mgnify:FL=1|tara:strand:- start:2103 stop:2309 length:207 start_codon:yes stop_codon:yes gene_type:complete